MTMPPSSTRGILTITLKTDSQNPSCRYFLSAADYNRIENSIRVFLPGVCNMLGIRFLKVAPTTHVPQFRRGKLVRNGASLVLPVGSPKG